MLDRNGDVAVCDARILHDYVSFAAPLDYEDAFDCEEPAVTKEYAWGHELFACKKHRNRLVEEINARD